MGQITDRPDRLYKQPQKTKAKKNNQQSKTLKTVKIVMKNIKTVKQTTKTAKVVKPVKNRLVSTTKTVSKRVDAGGKTLAANQAGIKSLKDYIGMTVRIPVIPAVLLIMTLLLIFWLAGAVDAAAMSAMIVPGTLGGNHVASEPLTLTNSAEASPGLAVSEIDRRIVKIRPMATPVDQISRLAGARRSGSMEVEYYSVDTVPGSCTLAVGHTVSEQRVDDDVIVAKLTVSNPGMFAPTETIMVPSVNVDDQNPLVLYVLDKDTDGSLTVRSINWIDRNGKSNVPTLKAGTMLVRMGRAAGELDVQTSQFQALPKRDKNFCQIFKMQIEESTLHSISNKAAGWTFNDQEESAIMDMRRGMEKNYLFGSRAKIFNSETNTDVWLTGGIWGQAGKEYHYDKTKFDADKLIELCREAFTGQGSSARKILIGGSKFVEMLSKMEHTKIVNAAETTTRWGLDFTEISTNFGKLYVMISETFDECGHEGDAMIIDPEYMTKYCHIPFTTNQLDLQSAGVRNTRAVVITEASCLVLRYPTAHVRIIADVAKQTELSEVVTPGTLTGDDE